MTALALVMTTEGLSKFTAAQVDDDIDLTVTEVALTDADFVVAPTLTALPGEFRRLTTVSGEAVGDNIVHLTIRDEASVAYTARGFGLFLADGTLFAVYGQPDPLFQKSVLTTFFAAIDIAFPTTAIDNLTFGDTNFLNPPATTTRKGVIEIATQAETDAGADDQRATVPQRVRRMIETHYLPVGTLTMFWGAEVDVPPRWAICDGRTVARSDGAGDITTPDMRGRIPTGASAAHPFGDTFGEASRTIGTASAGAHGHEGTAAGHSHAVEVSGNTAIAATGASVTAPLRGQVAGGGTGSAVDSVIFNDATHSHNVAINGTAAVGDPVPLSIGESGDHFHSVTIDITPPSIALHFIMRV